LRKRVLNLAGPIAVGLFLAAAPDAMAQKFTQMKRQVEGFLTGLWAKTAAPADRPPNEGEVIAGLAHCDEPMIDPKNAQNAPRALFPSEDSSRGDVSMFRSDGAFVVVERMLTPGGIPYPQFRKMTVGAVQQQTRITVRFVSRSQWVDGSWMDSQGAPSLWGDALLGDIDVGGNTEHFLVLAKANAVQTTYIKCGS